MSSTSATLRTRFQFTRLWSQGNQIKSRQLVEFALPFSLPISGVRVTFRSKGGGVCVTFLKRFISDFWRSLANFRSDNGYAKELFSNLSETKDGRSPFCLKENLKRNDRRSFGLFFWNENHHKKKKNGDPWNLPKDVP